MVYFKDSLISKKSFLTIIDDKDDDVKEGTNLLVRPSAFKAFSKKSNKLNDPPSLDKWSEEVIQTQPRHLKMLFLHSPHYQETLSSTSYSTLGHKIIAGEATWGSNFKPSGEFSYIPLYWEWLEDVLSQSKELLTKAQLHDAVYASLFTYGRNANVVRAFCESWCPVTNTLHTVSGEMSISLWDMRVIAGLPISGGFYDEIVPIAEDLYGTDNKGRPLLPKSCQYLFAAYRYLQEKAKKRPKITIVDWVEFWFRGRSKYHPFPKEREAKKSQPKVTEYPSGVIKPPSAWSQKVHAAFDDIEVEDEFKKETYLAALLSCWLCVFALPVRDPSFIRPGTFKIASMMASGRVFGLAVPVLTSIYRGLNGIANSSQPGKSGCSFPIHYVYAWLGQYFGTHCRSNRALVSPVMTSFSGVDTVRAYDGLAARMRIRLGKHVVWDSTMLDWKSIQQFEDDDHLSPFKFAYFVSLRSSYLSMRCEDLYVIEPYSPHRFCRQFGFYQHIPGDLKEDIRSGSLEQLYQYYKSCMCFNTKSTILIPARHDTPGALTTKRYSEWWSGVHGDYFEKGTNILAETPCSDLPKTASGNKAKKGMIEECVPKSHVMEVAREQSDETPNVVSDIRGRNDPSPPVDQLQQAHLPPVCNYHLRSMVVTDEQGDVTGSQVRGDNHSSDQEQRRKRLRRNSEACDKVFDCPQPVDALSDGDNEIQSPGDRCWKHLGNKVQSTIPEEIAAAGVNNFFKGVPSSSQPMNVIGEQIPFDDGAFGEDNIVPLAEKSNCSEGSISGPAFFDLVAERVECPYVQLPQVSEHVRGSGYGGTIHDCSSFSIGGGIQDTIVEAHTNDELVVAAGPGLKAKEQNLPDARSLCQISLPEASMFDVGIIISNARRQAAQMMGENIKDKLLRSSFEQVPSLKGKFEELFAVIAKNGVDPSSLKSRVETFVTNATRFNSVQSAYSGRMTPEMRTQRLAVAQRHLTDVLALKDAESKHGQTLQVDLANAESKRDELKKELEQLDNQIEQLRGSISQSGAQLSQRQSEISRVREEWLSIDQAPVLSDVDSETLKTLLGLLEKQRDELKDLKWM